MKPIGGYFELELPNISNFPQKDGIFVNSGRNALELVLNSIRNIQNIYIPYFTCDVVLEPLEKLNIQYTFYNIDENLELPPNICLNNNEYLLYTNYFGIKDNYIKKLSQKYGDKLIVDNAQALYAEPTANCIYSPRKFVGIPDGGIAYCNKENDIASYARDYSADRCEHLLIRHDKEASEGYMAFKGNSAKLKSQTIKQMSNLTIRLIDSIDFNFIKEKRINNFNHIHKYLKESNLLDVDNFGEYACPMIYPYYTDDKTLKQKLISNKIFVATYWPNVFEWCKFDSLEYNLSEHIIAIPIDQRYGIEDMNRIIKEIML